MKCKKCLIASILMVMLVMLLAQNFFGVNSLNSGKCGENLVWTLSDTGTLTISGTGEMYNFSDSFFPGWADYKPQITAIVISDGVETIGNNAFYGCEQMKQLSLGKDLTQIGEFAFRYCNSIEEIRLSEGIQRVGDYAFSGCYDLQRVTVGDSVTEIGGYSFSSCENLRNVEIGNGVESIGKGAFEYCSNLTRLSIGTSVTTIDEDAFRDCCSLEKVVIPDSVKSIAFRAFADCYALTAVSLQNNLESIGDYAFSSCTNLREIVIPDTVTYLGWNAFYGCESMKTAFVGNGITVLYDGTFSYCTNLEQVTLPKGLKEINLGVFPDSDKKLKDVYFGGTQTDWEGVSIGAYNEALQNATIHYMTTHTHTYISTTIKEPTCSEQGLEKYTCIYGDDSYTEIIPKLNHSAPDINGNCTFCGQHIKDVTPTQPTDPTSGGCPWCGGTHSGFFGGILGFFHRILAALFGARY